MSVSANSVIGCPKARSLGVVRYQRRQHAASPAPRETFCPRQYRLCLGRPWGLSAGTVTLPPILTRCWSPRQLLYPIPLRGPLPSANSGEVTRDRSPAMHTFASWRPDGGVSSCERFALWGGAHRINAATNTGLPPATRQLREACSAHHGASISWAPPFHHEGPPERASSNRPGSSVHLSEHAGSAYSHLALCEVKSVHRPQTKNRRSEPMMTLLRPARI